MPARLAVDRFARLDIERVELRIQQARIVPVVLIDAHEQRLDLAGGLAGHIIDVAENRIFEEPTVRGVEREIDIQPFGHAGGQVEQRPLHQIP